MIQGLGRSGRVGLGTVAMGLLMAIFGSVGESILREVSSSHYGSELSTSILSAVARIGGVLLLCGFLILVLGQTGRRSMLLGWVDRKGWGKIGCGWVNKLGLAFVAIGFLTSVAGLEETLAILTVAGGAIILVGLIFHLTEAGTP